MAWVHSASAGVERVLTPTSRQRGLVITNARGVFSRPIAEYVLMMVLAVNRRLPQLLELAAERTWQPLEGRELRDTTPIVAWPIGGLSGRRHGVGWGRTSGGGPRRVPRSTLGCRRDPRARRPRTGRDHVDRVLDRRRSSCFRESDSSCWRHPHA
jgi:hypothetical protein